MILIQVHPQSFSEQELQEEKRQLVQLLQPLHLDSLYFQTSDALFNGFKEDTESDLLFGSEYIHERLLNLE